MPDGDNVSRLLRPTSSPERVVRTLRPLPFSIESGIYLQAEASVLTGAHPSTVRRWLQLERGAESISAVKNQPLVSFLDLISLRAVAALRRAGLPLKVISQGAQYMRAELDVAHPLATENLLTDGVHLYFAFAERLLATTAGGQLAAEVLIQEYLRDVKYRPVGRNFRLATSWEPPGVVIDPMKQRGAPCILGSRVQVSILAKYVQAGDTPDQLAALFDLDLEAVRQGLQWWDRLHNRAA